jgi:hypothetical protein
MQGVSKELYNCISNVAVWRVLRKPLHLKAYILSIIQEREREGEESWGVVVRDTTVWRGV